MRSRWLVSDVSSQFRFILSRLSHFGVIDDLFGVLRSKTQGYRLGSKDDVEFVFAHTARVYEANTIHN